MNMSGAFVQHPTWRDAPSYSPAVTSPPGKRECAHERLHAQVRRVDVFLRQQAERAERILAQAGSGQVEARVRAEARLRLARELANVLKAK